MFFILGSFHSLTSFEFCFRRTMKTTGLTLSFMSYVFDPFNLPVSLHPPYLPVRLDVGGLKWTRTTDLTLIRRAL